MPTPAQVARIANVSVQTVRNWSTDYADLLSAQARGEAGPRLFSDEDVDTVCTIASLRRTGMQPAEIIARIQADAAPTVIDVTPTATPQTPHSTPQPAPIVQFVPQQAHNALVARFEGMERMQHTLLRAALLWGILLGAIGGLGLAALFMWGLYLFA